MERSDEEWKEILTPEEYRIMREAGTEKPFSGIYNDHNSEGNYKCKGCDTILFDSKSKFDGHCGWPSFDEEIAKGIIEERKDTQLGMIRIEIVCSKCKSHLGHVFNDGPTKTGLRYCVNSASLFFDKDSSIEK